MTTKKHTKSQTSSGNPKKSRKSAAAKAEAVAVEATQAQPALAQAGETEIRSKEPVSSDTDVPPGAEKPWESDSRPAEPSPAKRLSALEAAVRVRW